MSKLTRKEELRKWADVTILMDDMRKKCCHAIDEASECRKCPFWQQEECLQCVSIVNNFDYDADDLAKMLAVGEAIYELQRMGCYKNEVEEDDW